MSLVYGMMNGKFFRWIVELNGEGFCVVVYYLIA